MRTVTVIGLLLLAVGVIPAAAHHGWSGYDATKELTGETPNPCVGCNGHVRLDVPGKIWLVVLAPPTRMESRGLPASKLQVGAKATVVGYPHRSNAEEMRAERIMIDGATVELR